MADPEAAFSDALTQFLDLADWASHNPFPPSSLDRGRELDEPLIEAIATLSATYHDWLLAGRGNSAHERQMGRVTGDVVRRWGQLRTNTTHTTSGLAASPAAVE